MADCYELCLPAIEIIQGSRRIYTFAVDGKLIRDFAAVSRVHREQEVLHGYQRSEVLSHIRAIRRYLESDGAMLPNAIVFAFDERVRFVPHRRRQAVEYAVTGDLVIPVDETLDELQRPALIVDGQQRSAALRDADLAAFPVAAVAFINDSQEDQRSQFILVNSTKPLPKGLIHELLPDTVGHLPPRYARRKLPAQLMMRLNADSDSPFRGRITMPTAPDGYIKDNSVLRMIENSLFEGALYQYRNPNDGTGDVESMLSHLKIFWLAVQHTWASAWDKPPRHSRLTHGVGIQALGYVMDSVTEGMTLKQLTRSSKVNHTMRALAPVAAWTEGTWPFSSTDAPRWNSLQNTPNDVRRLTNHLLRACV